MVAVAVAAACGKSLGRGGAESGTALKSEASVAGACRVHRGAALLQHRLAAAELQDMKWSCTAEFRQGMPAVEFRQEMLAIPLPPCESHCIPCEVAKRIERTGAAEHCAAQSERTGVRADAGASRGCSTSAAPSASSCSTTRTRSAFAEFERPPRHQGGRLPKPRN